MCGIVRDKTRIFAFARFYGEHDTVQSLRDRVPKWQVDGRATDRLLILESPLRGIKFCSNHKHGRNSCDRLRAMPDGEGRKQITRSAPLPCVSAITTERILPSRYPRRFGVTGRASRGSQNRPSPDRRKVALPLCVHFCFLRKKVEMGRRKRNEAAFAALLAVFALVTPFGALVRAQPFPTNQYVVDPEAEMTVPEIVRHWKYPVETYNAVTEDGYVLVLHRIPFGRSGFHAGPRPVVFLQHGLLCTSSVWIMNLPSQSLGFLLADAGYDVWMGNMRGNSYSRRHRDRVTMSQYWRFSWADMARYDLPAMIRTVLDVTGQKQVYYIGHSQGTLTMFSALSENQQLAKKIRSFFAIAPVGTIAHVKGLFRYLGDHMYNELEMFTMLFGDQEFLPNTFISRWLTELICGLTSTNPLCQNFLFVVSGPDSHQFNKTRIPVYLAHNPAGTSTCNVLHFAQMVRHRRQLDYDYGEKGNLQHYGKKRPPAFNISKIRVPMFLYYSDSDWLATPKDVENHLLVQLPKEFVREVKNLHDFNHNDFLWGLRAPHEVYAPIMAHIKEDWEEQQRQQKSALSDPMNAPTFQIETIDDEDLLFPLDATPPSTSASGNATTKSPLILHDYAHEKELSRKPAVPVATHALGESGEKGNANGTDQQPPGLRTDSPSLRLPARHSTAETAPQRKGTFALSPTQHAISTDFASKSIATDEDLLKPESISTEAD